MSAPSTDVVIIGGGVIGSAAAYFLALRGASVTVLEADPSYRTASSALSASSIRQQFSTPVCIAMSRFGFAFLSAAAEHLSLGDEPVDIGLVEGGYLYLATQQNAEQLRAAVAVQKAHDVAVALLPPPELERKFPWLNTEDLSLAALGLAQEGWFDGYSVMQAFRRKARALGASYRHAHAIGLEREGPHVGAVVTDQGRVCGRWFVNAAGFRAGAVAAWAGFAAPIAPERHCIFTFACTEAPRDMPLIVDTSGVYVRRDGAQFLTGAPAAPVRAGDASPNFDVEHAQFEDIVWPSLAHRAPAFETLRLTGAWAGQYDMNLFDHNALIGAIPGLDNMVIAAGFSGHGLQHAPAAGRAVSELILDGRYTTLDVSPLDPLRVLQNNPIRELNII